MKYSNFIKKCFSILPISMINFNTYFHWSYVIALSKPRNTLDTLMQLFITHQENVLTSAGKLVDTVWGPRVVVAFVQVCECWSLQCWSKCRINNEHFLANSKTNYNVTLLCYKLTSLTFQLQPSTYLCLYEIPQAHSLNLCFLLLIFPWIHSILCPVSFFLIYILTFLHFS